MVLYSIHLEANAQEVLTASIHKMGSTNIILNHFVIFSGAQRINIITCIRDEQGCMKPKSLDFNSYFVAFFIPVSISVSVCVSLCVSVSVSVSVLYLCVSIWLCKWSVPQLMAPNRRQENTWKFREITLGKVVCKMSSILFRFLWLSHQQLTRPLGTPHGT